MNFKNTLEIVEKNTLNESISIENVEGFVGDLINDGLVRTVTKKICYTAPLTQPSGFVFSAHRDSDSDTLDINKNFVEAVDHPVVTKISKEIIEDVTNQFGKSGSTLISNLIKRDLFIEQDKDLFTFINDMATEAPQFDITSDNLEADLVRLTGYIDELGLLIREKVGAPISTCIIGSPPVIGLLKRMEDEESDDMDDTKLYSFAGKKGYRDLYVDLDATDDYVTVGINGDSTLRGVVYSPYSIATNFVTSATTGGQVIRVNNRYAFTRNPLDNDTGDSKFFIKTPIDITGSLINASLSTFITNFKNDI
jgi:hypothetical protein